MDNLIVMMPRATGGPGRGLNASGPVGGSAEILFFTGVRYFRQVEDVVSPPARPRRRRSTKAKAMLMDQQQA